MGDYIIRGSILSSPDYNRWEVNNMYRSTSNIGAILGYSGYGNSIFSNLSQYSSIRSGAYSKLTKAYYGRSAGNSAIQNTSAYNRLRTTAYNSQTALKTVGTEAAELTTSANVLTDTGKNSLFANGDTYDADKAFKATSDFVNNYNDTVSALSKTDNTNVRSAGASMTRMTGIMKDSLSKVGISVGVDGKMSIDEEGFKKADVNTVKSLFNGNGSYAKIVSNSAQRVQTTVNTQQLYGGSVYGNSGSYYSALTGYGGYGGLYSGYGFNSFF